MIRAENITRIHTQGEQPVVAVENFSATVGRGEFVALMGASGSGKTTVLQILGCLDRPSSGAYWLDGELVSSRNEGQLARIRNRMIGFVFQASHFIDYLDLGANIALPGFYSRARERGEYRRRSETLMQQVGLGHRIHHLPAALSGGERQRAAIARALYNQPRLLLADEPTGNLDRENTRQVMDLLRDLHRGGLTIVLVTHDQDVAARADRILRLDNPGGVAGNGRI